MRPRTPPERNAGKGKGASRAPKGTGRPEPTAGPDLGGLADCGPAPAPADCSLFHLHARAEHIRLD